MASTALSSCIQRSLCAARNPADARDRTRAHKGSGNHQAEMAERRRNSPAVCVSVLAPKRWPRRQQAAWLQSCRVQELQAARRTLRTRARRPLVFLLTCPWATRAASRPTKGPERKCAPPNTWTPPRLVVGSRAPKCLQRMAVSAASSFTGSASLAPLTDARAVRSAFAGRAGCASR